MTLNTSNQEKAIKQASPGFFKDPSFWKRDKKHWLLAIALGCLFLWWWGSSLLKNKLFKKAVELLPVIGGACFAADSIIKLTDGKT